MVVTFGWVRRLCLRGLGAVAFRGFRAVVGRRLGYQLFGVGVVGAVVVAGLWMGEEGLKIGDGVA